MMAQPKNIHIFVATGFVGLALSNKMAVDNLDNNGVTYAN